jgi:excisionase family DNA binding protein
MSELEQRLAYGIDELCKMASLGRTTLYKDIAEGRLRAVKNGRRTVILRDDAMAFLAALPALAPRGSIIGVRGEP